MKVLLGIFFLFVGIQWSPAQLEISANTKEDEKLKEKNVNEHSTALFLGANWSQTSRILSPNTGYFGEELGERAVEGSLNTWSYFLGVRGELKAGFFWDGGLAFLQNGESYSYKNPATDSSFSYKTTYSYVGMPLKINYAYGKALRIYGGAGLLPQMFFGYKQQQEWTTVENRGFTNDITTKSGYNSFVLSAVASIGLELSIHNNWRIFASPELRWQLNSSYLSQDAYIHKGRVYGITFGLIRNL
jgi:hypothetical protein